MREAGGAEFAADILEALGEPGRAALLRWDSPGLEAYEDEIASLRDEVEAAQGETETVREDYAERLAAAWELLDHAERHMCDEDAAAWQGWKGTHAKAVKAAGR